jgi:hypothetical protein
LHRTPHLYESATQGFQVRATWAFARQVGPKGTAGSCAPAHFLGSVRFGARSVGRRLLRRQAPTCRSSCVTSPIGPTFWASIGVMARRVKHKSTLISPCRLYQTNCVAP